MGQKKRKKLWSAEKKFETILLTAPMNEAGKSGYCRKHGIYPAQLKEWKEDCLTGCRNAPDKKYIKEAKEKEQKYKRKTMALEKELRRKEKALAEAAALFVLKKKSGRSGGSQRTNDIHSRKRKSGVFNIEEACKTGARQNKACALLGITERTLQRWKNTADQSIRKDQRQYSKSTPANKLLPEEKQEIIKICNTEEYVNLPPSQIVPALADQGIFIASESTFYRVLHENGQ